MNADDVIMTRHLIEASQIVGRLVNRGIPTEVEDLRTSFFSVPTGGRFSVNDFLHGLKILHTIGLVENVSGTLNALPALARYCEMPLNGAIEQVVFSYIVDRRALWLYAGMLEDGAFASEVVPTDSLQWMDSLLGDRILRDEVLLAAARKVDAERKANIGLLGELAVISEIEASYRDRGRVDLDTSIRHVSMISDELGYDIQCSTVDGNSLRKLEIKTCSKVGDLRVYLTRNECRRGLADPEWRLVVCTLKGDEVEVAGWCLIGHLTEALPLDGGKWRGRWETASLVLSTSQIVPGLPLE